MDSKQKAKDLVEKFNYDNKHFLMLDGKQCALICVEEILQEFENVMTPNPFKQYWQEVKKEIKKI